MVLQNKSNKVGDSLIAQGECYIDMDGVLVDFFSAWAKLSGVRHWRDIKNIQSSLDLVRKKTNFWIDLKPTRNYIKLLQLIKKVKGEYNILSAPLENDSAAEEGKRNWINRYLIDFFPKSIIFTRNKYKYAVGSNGTPNILIDDYGENIRNWARYGGIGIKHKDYKFERTKQKVGEIFNIGELISPTAW